MESYVCICEAEAKCGWTCSLPSDACSFAAFQTGVNSTCYLNSGTMACAWCVLCLRAKSSNQSHLAPHPKIVIRNEGWAYSMICLRVYMQMHSLLCPAGGEKAWARQHSHHERNGPDIQRALHRGLHP